MRMKVSIISLGCARNLVDSELIMGRIKGMGFHVSEEPEDADMVIVNTCAFVEDAKKESIDTILKAVELKKQGRIKKVVVTGCMGQRYHKQLSRGIPEIDCILGVDGFKNIDKAVEALLNGGCFVKVSGMPQTLQRNSDKRLMLTPGHYAYLKIAEGCCNRCSYCAIYNIRGPLKSRTIKSILSEIKYISAVSKKTELNIIAQDTSSYGMDIYKKAMLPELLENICSLNAFPWVRLLYTHPRHFTDALIDVIAKEPAVCKYIDLPIQHANDRILSAMNRGTDKKGIIALIKKIRQRIPQAAIRTSVIVGFPGETEKEFAELLDFITDMEFERLGAFIYSREEGTPAYNYKNQVAEEAKNERFSRIMCTQQKIAGKINQRYLGKTLEVIIEDKPRKGVYTGRTRHDAPEVDGIVHVNSPKHFKTGDLAIVEITDTLEYDLVGNAKLGKHAAEAIFEKKIKKDKKHESA